MNGSIYLDIAKVYRQQITQGTLQVGQRLPTVKALAQRHSVSINTAHRALQNLQDEGYIEARGRNGCVVLAEPGAQIIPERHRSAKPATPRLRLGLLAHWNQGHSDSVSPHFVTIARLLSERLYSAGNELHHLVIPTTAAATAETVAAIRAAGLQALLAVSELPPSPGLATAIAATGCHYVSFATGSNAAGDGDIIAVDDEWAIMELTRQLYALGHRHIAYLGTDLDWAHRRGRACAGCLAELGLASCPEDVRYLAAEYPTIEEVLPQVRTMGQYTAIIGSNDHMGAVVTEALRQLGRRMPEDVSVTGYDNFPVDAQKYSLTSVAVPEERVVSTFLALVASRLAGDPTLGDQVTIRLHPLLIPRSSCAPPPSARHSSTTPATHRSTP